MFCHDEFLDDKLCCREELGKSDEEDTNDYSPDFWGGARLWGSWFPRGFGLVVIIQSTGETCC
jgi:hypothetical protein